MSFITLRYRRRQRTQANRQLRSSATSSPASSRTRRTGAVAPVATNGTSSATVQRGLSSSDDRRQSLKLTVKAPPSKLREVMRANEVEALLDTLGGGKVLDGPRSSRRAAAASRQTAPQAQRPRYAEYGESESSDDDDEEDAEDEDDQEEDEEEDDDEEEEEQPNDFDELGAEAEGGTDDEDVEMEDAPNPVPPPRRHVPPKPPKITLKPPAKTDSRQPARPKLIVTPAKVGPVKAVEDQEMEDDPDDDEVETSSELSDDEDEDTSKVNDEDAEGEDEDVEDEDAVGEEEEGEGEEGEEGEEGDDNDDLSDDSDETPGSGTATPDINKLTKRQRGRPEDQTQLMALDMAPQQRKFFTDAEKAMKKDEHARKRKELTKRKVQEEKTAALNRLLKPQVSKARGAAPKPETLAAAAAAAAAGVPYEEEEYVPPAHPVYTRWVSNKDGFKVGVPEEWLGKRVGNYFGPPLTPRNGPLVQEVD
ncbi:hypothetical protein LTR84_008675 [Exophiala bonariae]|uniref:INO80 complex subunit B-like conserved region domain-containing protein n=1 Tax=Exophiala bonariae TaxID=1690606 RepID=A0AAV9MY92_9EURO|nr:hypothetical protein LTR84_008675 [Exophiala bonariae]